MLEVLEILAVFRFKIFSKKVKKVLDSMEKLRYTIGVTPELARPAHVTEGARDTMSNSKKIIKRYVCLVSAPAGSWRAQGRSRVTLWHVTDDGKTHYEGCVAAYPNTRKGSRYMDEEIEAWKAQGYEFHYGRPRPMPAEEAGKLAAEASE